jgi:tRNA pseudouridine55 synthase
MQPEFDGLLVIDKPSGITSRDVVNRAQRWFPRGARIGHTGTLDPLASGVLVLCVGAATRLTEYVQAMPKIYRAGVILGATSDTDDADGTVTPTIDAPIPTRMHIEEALAGFIGTIAQIPPAYSAAKVTGRRAYDLARKGKEVDLQPRQVKIERIDIESFVYPHLEIVVRCGKGTYIRALARDLGRQLGCGGYIASLRRLAIGSFTEADALSIDSTAATARARLLPPWRAVQDASPIAVADGEAGKLRQGQRIIMPPGVGVMPGPFALLDGAGRMLAIVEAVDGMLQPIKVFGVA